MESKASQFAFSDVAGLVAARANGQATAKMIAVIYQKSPYAIFSLRSGESFVREASNRGLHVNMEADPKWDGLSAKAPEAAGEIHTDFERGFIRAETIAFDDFIRCGGESGAREAGKLRSEGKDYVVQDGDVLLFRFNV